MGWDLCCFFTRVEIKKNQKNPSGSKYIQIQNPEFSEIGNGSLVSSSSVCVLSR